MNISQVYAVYISATGNTRKVPTTLANALAVSFDVPLEVRDFTLPAAREEAYEFAAGDLVVFGMPTYAGKLPNKLLDFVKSGFHGNGALAVPVVTFGNRSFDNSLAELCACLEGDGFHTIGAGAFACRHAFTDVLANGRPDSDDMAELAMLGAAGVDRVLTMDLHANQIQGFFDNPVDNLCGNPIFVDYYAKKFGAHCEDMVVVSPDVGSVARARTFAQKLHMNLAIVDKRRQKANQCEVMNVIGDVEGKECILFDDMVDTAGSLCNAAKAVVEVGGAKKVYACASHGVLSGPALERLEASCIEELALLDTIPAPVGEAELAKARIKYLTVAPMFAEAIERTYQEISIAKLFN